MVWYAIIAAAWFTTLAIRKLPGVKRLVDAGTKPFACDLCMSAWTTLLWNLDALDGCGRWDWTGWWGYLKGTAMLAAAVLVLLTAWKVVLMKVGWKDDPKPSDYLPPGDAP